MFRKEKVYDSKANNTSHEINFEHIERDNIT